MAMDLKRNKGKVTDIKTNIEQGEKTLEKLETTKENLMEARRDIEGSDMDKDAKKAAIDSLNRSLKENEEQGKEASDQLQGDVEMIEELKQETQESIDSTVDEKKKLEQKQALLDKFGLGNKLDQSIQEVSDSQMELEQFNESLIETEKELSNLKSKLGHL